MSCARRFPESRPPALRALRAGSLRPLRFVLSFSSCSSCLLVSSSRRALLAPMAFGPAAHHLGAHRAERPRQLPRVRLPGVAADGVGPVSWTPILLAGRRSPQCRSRDRRTRRHSDSRWSSWFGPDVHRESWLGSSSRRPRRYETGSRRLTATLASAPTVWAPRSVKRFVDCAERTGVCAKNVRS